MPLQDLFGRGVDIGPQKFVGLRLGGERKYSFGIYGRCDDAQALLENDWASERPPVSTPCNTCMALWYE